MALSGSFILNQSGKQRSELADITALWIDFNLAALFFSFDGDVSLFV